MHHNQCHMLCALSWGALHSCSSCLHHMAKGLTQSTPAAILGVQVSSMLLMLEHFLEAWCTIYWIYRLYGSYMWVNAMCNCSSPNLGCVCLPWPLNCEHVTLGSRQTQQNTVRWHDMHYCTHVTAVCVQVSCIYAAMGLLGGDQHNAIASVTRWHCPHSVL